MDYSFKTERSYLLILTDRLININAPKGSMEKAELLEILNDWNFWNKEQETGIARPKYLKNIERIAKTGQIIVITGVRRSGKSTIMQQYTKHLISNGTLPKNILYVNFEDVRLKTIDPELLGQIYNLYLEHLQPTEKPCILLDEVHKAPSWEKFARTLHELKKAEIIVSGSNAKMLLGNISSVLTGRHLDIEVYPLDFKEFLLFKGLTIKSELNAISQKQKIRLLLNEYQLYGGFPLVALQETKKELLEAFFEDIINKDIVENHVVAHISKLKSLAKFYLTNAGKRVSFNSLSKTLSLSLDTVERYSYYLEESYLLYFIKKFSYSVKEQERTMAVVYNIDNGIKSILGFNLSSDTGWLYQNIVANHLQQRLGKENLFYWMNATQEEVDFIVKQGTKIKQLIQVCYSIENPDIKKREINSLLKASRELKCKDLLVITDDKEGTELKLGLKIHYMPLWKWLLIE